MEDFIGKPVEPSNLFSTIIKWLPDQGNAPQTLSSDELPKEPDPDNQDVFERIECRDRPEAVFDVEVLKRIFEDDHEAQQILLQKFASQADEISAEFETAFRQHDLEQVRFHTHKLKSSARTVGANALADLCFDLETAARNEKWEEINALASDFKPAVDRVRDFIKRL